MCSKTVLLKLHNIQILQRGSRGASTSIPQTRIQVQKGVVYFPQIHVYMKYYCSPFDWFLVWSDFNDGLGSNCKGKVSMHETVARCQCLRLLQDINAWGINQYKTVARYQCVQQLQSINVHDCCKDIDALQLQRSMYKTVASHEYLQLSQGITNQDCCKASVYTAVVRHQCIQLLQGTNEYGCCKASMSATVARD